MVQAKADRHGGLVILGAGHAGSQMAASLRLEGFDGTITLVSDEAEIPYHKPPLSKTFLKSPDQEPQLLRGEGFYAENHINALFGCKVTAIERAERRLIKAGGGTIPFETLVIAAGARSRALDLPQAGAANVLSLRVLDDARKLREALPEADKIAVIGGGFIGLEAAAALAGMGKKVTVLEMADRLLGRAVSPPLSAHVCHRLGALGAEVRLQTGVQALQASGDRVSGMTLSSGEALSTDLVLVGIGAVPNVELAEAAGLDCQNGIVVDETMRTKDANIYAIGDCTAYHHWQTQSFLRLESVQNATDQARHAARAILGSSAPFRELPWFWSDIGPMKLQIAGLSVGSSRQLRNAPEEAEAFSVYHMKEDRLIAVESVNQGAAHMLARKLIAAGLTPPDAVIAEGPKAVKLWLAEQA